MTIERPGSAAYYPSVDEARSWRAGITLGIVLGVASIFVSSTNIVLLVWLVAEVKDLSNIEQNLVELIVSMAGIHVR